MRRKPIGSIRSIFPRHVRCLTRHSGHSNVLSPTIPARNQASHSGVDMTREGQGGFLTGLGYRWTQERRGSRDVSVVSRLNGKGCGVTFDDRGKPRASSGKGVDVSVSQIKTRQTRRLRSSQVGEMFIEHTYLDRPASLETWIDHCTLLAAEFRISALDVHRALFTQLPEIFGR